MSSRPLLCPMSTPNGIHFLFQRKKSSRLFKPTEKVSNKFREQIFKQTFEIAVGRKKIAISVRKDEDVVRKRVFVSGEKTRMNLAYSSTRSSRFLPLTSLLSSSTCHLLLVTVRLITFSFFRFFFLFVSSYTRRSI